MNLTVKNKLYLMVGIGLFMTIMVGATGFFSLNKMNEGIRKILDFNTALRNHTDADMMHDALRSDVLAALIATNEEEKSAVRSDLNEHSEIFSRAINENKELTLTPEIRALLTEVEHPLSSYLESANAMVSLAKLNPISAKDKLADFYESFKSLEGKMSNLSTAIEKEAFKAKEAEENHKRRSTAWILLTCLVSLIFQSFYALKITGQIDSSIHGVSRVLQGLARGDLTERVNIFTQDEFGSMGESLNNALSRVERIVLSIKTSANRLSTTSQKMSEVSSLMSSNASMMTNQSQTISTGAEEVSSNVQTVATATEEMTSSIKEISRNTSEANRVTETATHLAVNTNKTIEKLGYSSNEIGNIIKLITSIAQQTNLLALNATIEAARAGEAGKGFAVVAGEVKELSKETAKATEDISQKIETIQMDTKAAVNAIREITTVVDKINSISTTIASAVEEQTATTNEIGRSISEVARGSSDIAKSIGDLTQVSQTNNEKANDIQIVASELAESAKHLDYLVGQFKINVGSSDTGSIQNKIKASSLQIAA